MRLSLSGGLPGDGDLSVIHLRSIWIRYENFSILGWRDFDDIFGCSHSCSEFPVHCLYMYMRYVICACNFVVRSLSSPGAG